MTQDEKLKMFFDISMDDANKSNVMIVNEYKENLDHMYEEHVKSETARAEVKLKQMIETYRREKNAEMSSKQMEQRRENVAAKSRYIEEIFVKVKEQLAEFKNKSEYKEMLINQIKKILAYNEEAEGITVYIDESDKIYKDELEGIFECDIAISDKEILGGILACIPAKNISFDESFVSKMSEAKRKFVF